MQARNLVRRIQKVTRGTPSNLGYRSFQAARTARAKELRVVRSVPYGKQLLKSSVKGK